MNQVMKFRKALSLLLATVMILSMIPFHATVEAHTQTIMPENEINQTRSDILHEIRLEREINQGLVGFEGNYALPDDRSPVSVIVVFETAPVQVQLVEAEEEGLSLSYSEAVNNVEAAHDLFASELMALFGRARSASFEIAQEYRNAMNGVSMIVPADRVEAIVAFESVRAIFPDETVELDPIDEESLEEAIASHIDTQQRLGVAPGMGPGRNRMNADRLHDAGFRGEGVLVAVIDTGIEYRHPAFLGAFPSLADMHARGAYHLDEEALTWIGWLGAPGNADDRNPNLDPGFTGPFPGIPPGVNVPAHNFRNFQYNNQPIWYGNYRFLGRNLMEGFHTVIPEHDFPHFYPMETFPGTPVAPHATTTGLAAGTSHGTHVAGTIVGRDTGRNNAILGVAPEAQMIAYRVLAQGGGSITTVMRGIEWSYLDRADVVNMSLGGGSSTTNALTGTAINNLMLSRNHQITFVLSAGNGGAGGFTTITDPAPATKAITVAAFDVGTYTPVATFNGLDGIESITSNLGFVTNSLAARWENRDGRLISTFNRLPEDGTYRVFVMPRSAGSESPVGEPGSGIAADFDLLFETYGAEALQGAFVLIRRGSPFVNASVEAFNRGLGGVLSIDHNPAPGGSVAQGSNISWVPFFLINHQSGLAIRDYIAASDDTQYAEFFLTGSYNTVNPLRLASFSSRGPILMSHEIKPDIGAHGVNVWSANTRWHATGYSNSSGTSMSAPHIAGAVALLVNFSRENGGQWCNEEIKVRLMNTAIRLNVPHWVGLQTQANIRGSVFDTGAGQADVYAAAHAGGLVAVTYDRVVLDPRDVSFLDHFDNYDLAFATTRTGSFSFGGVNRLSPYQAGLDLDRTMMATITNHSTVAVTYDIGIEWINYNHPTNQNAANNGVTVRTSHERITVPAGHSRNFSATLTMPATAAVGHYEGFINVSANGQIVASMPFAAVMAERPPLLNNMSLHRSVISTSDYAQNETSRELGMNFIPQGNFSTRAWIFENAEGISHRNWMDDQFADYLVGFAGSNVLPAAGGDNFLFGGAANNPGTRLTAGQMHRAVIFDGLYLPADEVWDLYVDAQWGALNPLNYIHRGTTGTNWQLLSEGDYVIILEVGFSDWVWHFDTMFEFSVDNTPPEINDVAINGISARDGATITIADTEATIVGNVFDEWVAQAEAAGITFDIWNASAPQRQVNRQNNIAVFVQAEGQEAVRATVAADGSFEVTLTDLDAGNTIVNIYVIDNYSVLPATNRLFSTIPHRSTPFVNIPGLAIPGGMGVNPRTLAHQNTFQVDRFLTASSALNSYLNLAARLAYAPGLAGAANAAARNQHVWSGLNVTEMVVTIAVQDEAIISRLAIDHYEGIIDQEEQTITFQIPPHFLLDGRYYGHITELEADEDMIFFWAGNAEWPRQLGDLVGFATGDLVYVADGRVYTLIIEAPEGDGLINQLRIGSVNSVINQDAATITFTVPRHLMVNDTFRGPITSLEADQDTLIFWVERAEWPRTLGETTAISDGDMVYVVGGRVYTIRIVVR